MFARSATPLSDLAFRRIRQFFFRHSGIDLPERKRHLVAGRLRGRLASLGLDCYEAYSALIGQADQAAERQFLIDALTTNETYFFREPQHFQLLAREILPSLAGHRPRLWCAAASSGEEPYSLAMVLSDQLGLDNWELLASDLSSRTLQRAASGLYPMQRLEQFPEAYLKRFCLKGHGEYAGQLLIRRELGAHINSLDAFLDDPALQLGMVRGHVNGPVLDNRLARLPPGRLSLSPDAHNVFVRLMAGRLDGTLMPAGLYQKEVDSLGLHDHLQLIRLPEADALPTGAYLSRLSLTLSERRHLERHIRAMLEDGTLRTLLSRRHGKQLTDRYYEIPAPDTLSVAD